MAGHHNIMVKGFEKCLLFRKKGTKGHQPTSREERCHFLKKTGQHLLPAHHQVALSRTDTLLDDLVEPALSFGTSRRQLLFKVQLPLAMPTIMAGVNQTLMLALSMVVIASMIAVGGLTTLALVVLGVLAVGEVVVPDDRVRVVDPLDPPAGRAGLKTPVRVLAGTQY